MTKHRFYYKVLSVIHLVAGGFLLAESAWPHAGCMLAAAAIYALLAANFSKPNNTNS